VNRLFTVLALVLLAIGALAFFLTPFFWRPEPLLAFRMGIGAGIFAFLFILAVLIQLAVLAYDWGKEQTTRQVTRERDESHRQFLRRLDHELKNPLTGLQAALTNLREAQNDADIHAAVDNASQASSRLGRIFDLRKLSSSRGNSRATAGGGRQLVSEMVNGEQRQPTRARSSIVSVPDLPTVCDAICSGWLFSTCSKMRSNSALDRPRRTSVRDGRMLYIDVADSGRHRSGAAAFSMTCIGVKMPRAEQRPGAGAGTACQLHGESHYAAISTGARHGLHRRLPVT
jgi:hypothetical protein